MRSVGQVLVTLGTQYPHLTEQGEVDIHIRFQYRCYSNQEPLTPNQVKLIPLEVLRNIFSISAASPNPEIWGTCNMIILGYFLLICTGE